MGVSDSSIKRYRKGTEKSSPNKYEKSALMKLSGQQLID